MHTSSEGSKKNTGVLLTPGNNQAFEELEQSVKAALETYSNVHRGTGHFSMITTELYERARESIIDYLGLTKNRYLVVFCSVYGSKILERQLPFKKYFTLSSGDTGLPLGLRVLVIKKNTLPGGVPFQTGGSVVKMVSPGSVIWADSPQKFEAGTPCVINAITLAIALMLKQKYGSNCFNPADDPVSSANEIFHRDALLSFSGTQLLAKLRKMLVGHSLLVPTTEGKKPFINLDNAASTPTFSPIWDVVCKVWCQPQKMHGPIVQEVRNILSGFLSADSEKYETIFTCNTTEAINIAARFVQNEFADDSGLVILNTLLEHNSNELPWRYIPGAFLIRLSVDNEGLVNLEELELILKKYNRDGIFGKKRIRIVAICGASNVLGTFNDLDAISKIVDFRNNIQ
jgi:selenocysteine lyase/cysteine desulfurase